MFSDTPFWRLVWKEYRIHRPLWLAMLIGTPLLQGLFLLMIWMTKSARGVWLTPDGILMAFGVGFATSFIYLLGSGATTFSAEHEAATFDWQRVMPIQLARVFLAKTGFVLVSGIVLTFLVWSFTRAIFGAEAHSKAVGEWFSGRGCLYLAEVLAWSFCASLLIRHPLWSVIAAVTGHALMNYVVLVVLTSPSESYQLSPFQSPPEMVCWRLIVLVSLCLIDLLLSKFWFEDRLRLPRWCRRWKQDIVPSYPSDVELPAYLGRRQIGWMRMLWLSWRDGRWVMAGVLAWYGYNLATMRVPNDWGFLAWISFFGCLAFGLFAFAPEQWGGRFRYLTEHGCSPRIMWLSRQIIWLPPIALLCLITSWKEEQANAMIQLPSAQRAILVMGATTMPWLCYSAGQFAAMLFRRTVMAIAVGIGLCIAGGLWGLLMTSWLAPTWWAVGALPVIGLFVTWLKANDWIEERRDRPARWRTAFGLGVPTALLLIATATYRVVQIPVVTLPREWDDDTATALSRLTPAEQETLAIYRRALAGIEPNDNRRHNYDHWFRRVREEHPDWTDREIRAEAFESSNRDWWLRHFAIVPLLREAHRMAPVPLALAEVDKGGQLSDGDPFRAERLLWLMTWQAKQSLREGKLDQTWEDVLVAFELDRRCSQRAALTKYVGTFQYGSNYERQLLEIVAEWGRLPEQNHDRILTAIRKLEEFAARRDAVQREVHHQLLEAQSMLNEDTRWREYTSRLARTSTAPNGRYWGEEATSHWKLWKCFPWERWRSERAVRLHAWRTLRQFDQLQTSLEWNVPERYSVAPPLRTAALARVSALAPDDDRAKLLALDDVDFYSAESVMLRTTLLPPSLNLGHLAEGTFWDRAMSYRANMLLLALADFHREQGRYPESLNELAPSYFAEVPRDPTTAGPFIYFPRGVLEDVTSGSEDDPQFHVIVHKSTPFLMAWSNRGSPSYRIDSRQKPDGDWEFIDIEGKTLELPTAFRRGVRIWALPVR